MKKICIHPYLLQDANLYQKHSIGIISKEEDQVLQLKKTEQENNELLTNGIRTRRAIAQDKVNEKANPGNKKKEIVEENKKREDQRKEKEIKKLEQNNESSFDKYKI